MSRLVYISSLLFYLTLLASKSTYGQFGDFGGFGDDWGFFDDHGFGDFDSDGGGEETVPDIEDPPEHIPFSLLHNNVILISADDLGIDLLGLYDQFLEEEGRSNYANTPNIDYLAQNGVLFSRAYAYPTCSPTRASMLTGRYGFRTHVTYAIGQICPIGLEYPEPTIPLSLPHYVRKACFGKWHLRSEDSSDTGVNHVLDAGFDVYDGLLSGAISPMKTSYKDWDRSDSNSDPFDVFKEQTYCTSYFTDSAINWIEENKVIIKFDVFNFKIIRKNHFSCG